MSISILFIPQEKNNHKATILRPGFLLLFVGIYLINQLLIKSLTVVRPGVLGYSSEITMEKVIDLTNQERQKLSLPPLKLNPKLVNSATAKANDMFANNYWAHTSPAGMTPWDFFKKSGYKYSVAGENLAKDFYDTDSVIKAWMNSPTHRANIINTKYQEIGIGVVNGTLNGVKTTLVVQHFATPQASILSESQSLESEIVENQSASTVVSSRPLVSPLTLTKYVGGLLFVIIIGTLFIDGYIVLQKRHHRLSGSTAGHIGFLVVILLFMLFSHSGSIF